MSGNVNCRRFDRASKVKAVRVVMKDHIVLLPESWSILDESSSCDALLPVFGPVFWENVIQTSLTPSFQVFTAFCPV